MEKKDDYDAMRISWRDELKIINKELTGKIPFGEESASDVKEEL